MKTLIQRMPFVFDDGGRAVAGYKGSTGDCVTRAIAIATGKPYQEVYDALFAGIRELAATGRSRAAKHAARGGIHASPRGGVNRRVYQAYLESLGWRWVPTMKIGSGCKVHLAAGELPAGRLIVRISKHICAVIDGTIHDNHDPQRNTMFFENGKIVRIAARCVYGYFHKP